MLPDWLASWIGQLQGWLFQTLVLPFIEWAGLNGYAKYYALAAPLMSDGEAWLNLAKVYNNQGKKAEQRNAAQQALKKGVKNTAEAQRLANPK